MLSSCPTLHARGGGLAKGKTVTHYHGALIARPAHKAKTDLGVYCAPDWQASGGGFASAVTYSRAVDAWSTAAAAVPEVSTCAMMIVAALFLGAFVKVRG